MRTIPDIELNAEVLSFLSRIDEFKGAWRAYDRLAPDRLGMLKKVATIESVGSSTRIEGSLLSDEQVAQLLGNLEIQEFETRDEQEVAGYAEIMNIIFSQHETIPFTENYILQLHKVMLKFSEKDSWHRGSYKKSPNHVEAFDATGKSLGIIFQTASPFDTPLKTKELIDWMKDVIETRQMHPLLAITVFIVEFLAIHPFQDGNGRLSRILTTLLLLKCGYNYSPYSSLEAVIEKNKEGYYLALRQTQSTLDSDKPDFSPWTRFFLNALFIQKTNLERKLETEKIISENLPDLSTRIVDLLRVKARITISDAVNVTNANRNTIKKHLESLVKNNRIKKYGVGKGSWYTSN